MIALFMHFDVVDPQEEWRLPGTRPCIYYTIPLAL